MTRFSGIRLLAVSFVLWALAVWFFGAPHPSETEAVMEETATPAPVEELQESEAGAGESAASADTASADAAADAASSLAAAHQEAAAPPAPDSEIGNSSPQAAGERTGIQSASAPSPAGDPAIPASGTQAPPAAPGVGSVASVPGVPITPGAPIIPGAPITPSAPITPGASGDSGTRSVTGIGGGPDAPSGSVPPPQPGSLASDDALAGQQLNAARRAAWEGRLADAVAHYRAAARLRPNDHVVWGEMGNVLWTLRRWPEAAYALEGAATLLVRAGEMRAASDLVPVLGRIDSAAAYRIQQLLWDAARRQSG